MQSFTVSFLGLVLTGFILLPHSQAAQESDFVGMYTQGGMESQAQLFLLDDNTFCYTLMAGSLDLIKAGRWSQPKGKASINLLEVQPDTQIYPAIGRNLDRLGPPMVSINIDGYTLSNARSPVFAVTSTNSQPATFRPLFPIGKNGWSGTYSLPLMAPDQAKYFYIGDLAVDKFGEPLKLRMTQYKIENFDTIRIGFNLFQASPAMKTSASLLGNVLEMSGSRFGSKKPLNQKTLTDVRELCINPIMFPDKVTANQQEQQPVKAEMLKPVKSFDLDMTAISGEPIFGENNEGAIRGNDTPEGLIESEQKQLQAEFDSVKGEGQPADKFLQLVNGLAGKKRIKRHAPMVSKLYTELLVDKVGKGQLPVAEKMFFNFMENIYPAVQNAKNEAIVYNLSVIASQGLIITVATKNGEIRKLVFEKLLGDKFDINTHSNRTLIYNLACYYAIINNKSAMLDAIKQARKRKTPVKQFMDDSDFRSYWKDDDFLQALKD